MSSFELMLELLQRRMDEASESLSQLEVRVSNDYRFHRSLSEHETATRSR